MYANYLEKSLSEKAKLYLWARCATDIELFTEIYFGHYKKHPFNPFHIDTFGDYEFLERAVRRANAAPRGYAKSTIVAFIKPIHDVCYRLERFIVIVSNTKPQAIQKLKDIRAEFISNDRLIKAYGSMFPNRSAGAEDFIVDNDGFQVRFLAVGSATEVRGIRFGDARPSKIICDDIEHSTEVESEMLRDKMLDFFRDVISKIGDENTNIEFIGTILHEKSLLKNLIRNAKYKSREYKAVLSWAERKDLWDHWKKIYTDLDDDDRGLKAKQFYLDNEAEMMKGVEVLWPEKESYYYLMEEILETGYRSFMKEKQGSPLSNDEKVFDPEEMTYYTEQDDGLLIDGSTKVIPWDRLRPYGVIDPSTGQKKPSQNRKTDFTCILVGYQDVKTKRVFAHKDFTKRTTPTKFIKAIFDMHERYEFEKFGIETNLFRGLLVKNCIDERLRREKEQKKIVKIPFYDIVQTENKEKRIYTIEPKVSHNWIVFNRNGLSGEFYDQLFEFPKGSHDDCPDALEMLWSICNGKYKVSGLSKQVIAR